jgi:superfamily II DNA or RNA helicase
MKAMMEYPSKEKYTKKLMESINTKCIVFANTQEQADRLCRFSYHSGNPNSEENLNAFKEGRMNKLSCVLQLNEGINIPELRQGIIMHAYGNERKASQRIGRLLRLNPDEKAIVHILCYVNTVDEKWVKDALESFDQSKIVWREYDVKS